LCSFIPAEGFLGPFYRVLSALVPYEMLTRDGVAKTAMTGAFVAVLIATLILDVVL
jgi:hypothetical protein